MILHAKNILPAALALRATVGTRPSFSPSLPRKHSDMHHLMHSLLFSLSQCIDVLCPVAVALRGRVTDLSGDVECWPLAPPGVRPGKLSKKKNQSSIFALMRRKQP